MIPRSGFWPSLSCGSAILTMSPLCLWISLCGGKRRPTDFDARRAKKQRRLCADSHEPVCADDVIAALSLVTSPLPSPSSDRGCTAK